MDDIEIRYPIKFTPILKEKIWGGTKLKEVLNKNSPNSQIGESWELSGIEGEESIISNGFLIGRSIKEVIRKFKGKVIGEEVYNEFGDVFPLLFKFIDADKDLSIQLHPNDKIALIKHNSFGKTEMWYVVDAEIESRLIVGFNDNYTRELFVKKLNSGKLLEMLNTVNIKKNDSFFIEGGTIHAIGSGALIAEIQQTSHITYRVYDWDRVDKFGKHRELHTELALDAIDFTKKTNGNVAYSRKVNEKINLVMCDYFTTNKIVVNSIYNFTKKDLDSFVVYMCVEGNAVINVDGNKELLKKGETTLIPAVCKQIEILSDNAELLEVYIK